jgi:putative heme-binding domain-containing protein
MFSDVIVAFEIAAMACRILLVLLLTVSTTVSHAEAPRKIGMHTRVPWTKSRITGSLEAPPPYRTERIFTDIKLTEPVSLARAPGSERLFAVELRGKIYSFPDAENARQLDLVADLASIPGHWRTYGMAFHPRFRENRQIFLCYVLKSGDPKGSRVSRFKVANAEPPTIDLASEEILIEWPSGGHNGGCLEFGKDGLLFISTGDGSNPHPPDALNTGQNVGDLLASILRIDVDRQESGRKYAIPADNPFVKLEGARPEVWAYGLRNPWKISVDPKSGDLWVGDVGWEMWEYIFRVERGGNYGWSLFEGRQPVHPEGKRGPTPVLPPTIDHDHTEARSITGGRFYYGHRLMDLHGAYIYGDYVTGKLWGLRHDGAKVTWHQCLADSPLEVIDFAVGRGEELYILDYGGAIHRLVVNPSAKANANFPRKLSETGLFAALREQVPSAGVLPYSINAEPWADHATAERFFAVTGTPNLGTYTKSNLQQGIVKGAWIYPTDTVFAKTISLEMERGNPSSRRRLETQILHRDGLGWRAYNYIWNDEQTEAVLQGAEGFDRTFTVLDPAEPTGKRQQTWHFASRTECLICHTTRAGSILGFNIPQLNREHLYGKTPGHQLATLEHLGFLEEKLPEKLPRIAPPFDAKENLHDRARAYLHANCAHCHRRGGGGTAIFELLYELDLKKTLLVGTPPAQGAFGIHNAENVAAGDPFRSVLYYRLAKLGRGRMPYSGSNLIDAKGLSLIHDWIADLAPKSVGASLSDAQRQALSTIERTPDAKSVAALLSTTSGALALLHALDTRPLPADVRKETLGQAMLHPDVQVRDLFERFIPEEQRVKRLGTVIKASELLTLSGDRERGRRVFFQTGQCKNCHKIGGEGVDIGPDLSHIGKKLDRAKILTSILEPSKDIEPAFTTYVLETTNGTVHTGLLVAKSEKAIVMKDAQGKLTTFQAGMVESLVPQRTSLMPELLLRDMTAREVADLLEFLAGLR